MGFGLKDTQFGKHSYFGLGGLIALGDKCLRRVVNPVFVLEFRVLAMAIFLDVVFDFRCQRCS